MKHSREQRRLAWLMCADVLGLYIDTSDNWLFHPETNERLDGDDVAAIKKIARDLIRQLEDRAYKIQAADEFNRQ